MHLNKKSAGPLYLKAYKLLKDQIEQGKLKKGEFIPSECQLANDLKVSRVTIRQALLKLQKENYITRKRSYGTQVSFSSENKRDEKAIAVLVVDITKYFFAEILKGINDQLNKEGYKLILCDTENSAEKEKECLLRHKDTVGGFIIAPATGSQNHGCYGQIFSEKIPLVFIDRYLPEFNVDAVVSDNMQGGYLAANHLLELGHRKIAFLSEPECTSILERIAGYKKALLEYGSVSGEELILHGKKKRGFQNGYSLIQEVIENFPEVSAVICSDDNVASGVLKRLSELCIKVPEHFSVVGFDNAPFSSQLCPPLTTINQQKKLIGKMAAELVVKRITTTANDYQKIVIPVSLITRDSTTIPPKQQ